MTVQTLANILIGVVLIGWIVYRQLTWRIVSISKMWRLPLILGIIGVVMLAQTKDAHLITAVDLAALAVELVVALAIGAIMGRIAVFRPRSIRLGDAGDPLAHGRGDRRGGRRDDRRADRGDRDRRGDFRSGPERHLNPDGTETVLETRTGWVGLALWIVMIAVRIGIDMVATELGSVLATATGVILVMVAANRIARVMVFAARVQNSAAVTA